MKATAQSTKYQVIKAALLDEIRNGTFKPGEKFYSESELKSVTPSVPPRLFALFTKW
jgi:DNA-binding GntR family transcriptional regulator